MKTVDSDTTRRSADDLEERVGRSIGGEFNGLATNDRFSSGAVGSDH